MSLVQRFKYEGTDAEEEVGGYKKSQKVRYERWELFEKGERVVFFLNLNSHFWKSH